MRASTEGLPLLFFPLLLLPLLLLLLLLLVLFSFFFFFFFLSLYKKQTLAPGKLKVENLKGRGGT